MPPLPEKYLGLIVQGLTNLRSRNRRFEAADAELIFGTGRAAGKRLPRSTERADCIRWIEELSYEELQGIIEHGRLFATGKAKQEFRAFARFQRLLAAESLAANDSLVVVGRDKLHSNLQLVDRGPVRLLRVGEQSGHGVSFTTDVIQDLVGARSGGTQKVITIDLAGYADDIVRRVTTDLLKETGKVVSANEGDVTSAKYIDQLGEFVVKSYIDVSDPPDCAWIVFDRCLEAEGRDQLLALLRSIAMAVNTYRQHPACPRVLYLEAKDTLLARFQQFGNGIVEGEELQPVTERELRLYCELRGIAATTIDEVLDELKAPITGKLRLTTMHHILLKRIGLYGSPPARPGPNRSPARSRRRPSQ